MKQIIFGGALLLLTAADALSEGVMLNNYSKFRIDLLIDGTHRCTALVNTHDGTRNAGWCQVNLSPGVYTLTTRWPNGETKTYANVDVPKGKFVTLRVD